MNTNADPEHALDSLRVLNACRNRMANAFNMFAAAKSDADRARAAGDFWAADQDFCLNAQDIRASAPPASSKTQSG